ncbi:ComF family protein [Roseobacter sp. HKCCA0434]|uniref:ComF family protein n=1 Tax=Roseobacter sp. HKCCA0434 TaxID=3079297 RepID=UPI002905D59D|nr:ComF family protein [Roseobacter sp. HKCCA0434]
MLTAIRDLIYPPRCMTCPAETALAGGLCPDCFDAVEFISGTTCALCGTPVDTPAHGQRPVCEECERHPRPWTEGRATLVYGGIGRRAVLQLKHGDRLDIVPALATWMRRAGGDLIGAADLIVPVPLHWSRLVKRRYNQSAELVRALDPAKAVPELLARPRRTRSLDGTTRGERAAELDGAIAVHPRHADRVAEARVLIVDDVMTTGATLDACTRALLDHGASGVDVLVLARVVREPRDAISAGR